MSGKTIISERDLSETYKDMNLNMICKKLSYISVEYYAYQMIDDIIQHDYFYFCPEEQTFLQEEARASFAYSDKQAIDQYLQKEYYQYLSENDYLNIQGFLTFRAEEFTQYLQITIDEVIADYLSALETNELIDYLKKYLSTQKPLIKKLYIIVSECQNQYTVLNDQLKQIVSICDYDDLFLNTIISIAPETIYVYGNMTSRQMKHILTELFKEHISFYEYSIILENQPSNSGKE